MKKLYLILFLCSLVFSCDITKASCSDYTPAACATANPLSGKTCVLLHNRCVDQISVAGNFQELEEINRREKDSGFKDKSIFVDITANGGKEALKVMRNLKSEAGAKKCHFGVACFVNFSLGAANKSDRIIVLDYDPVVIKFNRIARDLLIISATPEEFKQKLIKASEQDEEILTRNFYPKTKNPKLNIDNLGPILNIEESFLAKEENFKYIKKLAEEGKIHIIQGSIYDQELIKIISELARKDECVFDTLFISNVYDWNVDENKRKLLAENIKTISNNNTKIVEVVPNSQHKSHVNIVYYEDPQSKELYDPLIMRGQKGVAKQRYPAAPLLVE